jgi:flagellar motility protein MotE (MotC chaperone)
MNANQAPPAASPRKFKLRLLPVAIFGASLLLTVKVGMLLTPGAKPGDAIAVTPSRAQQAQQPGARPTPLAPAPASPGAAPPAAQPAANTAPAKPAEPAAAKADAAKTEPEAPSAVPGQRSRIDPVTMSQSEIDILQALGERRKQLDERERAIEQREALMKAAEQRITEKVNELKAVQAKLEVAVKKTDVEKDDQFKRLVKIYETMKPKEAARIFEQLDDNVLLEVAERMKESKLAPVLASMEPKRATTLTVELAKRRESGRAPGSLSTGG